MPLDQIGQIAVLVRDLDRAVSFYRDVLGMTFLFQAPPQLAFFDCGGVRLMLDVPEDAAFQGHSSVLYYKVPDMQQTHQELTGKGVVLLQDPHLIAKMPDHDLWMAFFQDPEGNLLGLMCEVRS